MTDEWHPRLHQAPLVTWPVPMDPSGRNGPTRGQAAGPRWRRTGRNLYAPAAVDGSTPEQRIVEAFARSRGRGVITGWASLRLHRAAYFDGLGIDARTAVPVPLVEGDARLRSTPEVLVLRDRLPAADIVLLNGVRCTIPERALLDHLARLDDLREAVVALDMTVAAQLTSIRRFAADLDRRPGARGSRLARAVLPLADEGSASPPESRFRLIWQLDAGWPQPLVNRDVFDLENRFLGRPDLLDPERGIVGEFAGAVHRHRSRHRRDVRREDLFRRAGLEYVEVVGADLHDRTLVVDRMEAAASRAGSRPRLWRLGRAAPPLDDLLDQRDAMIALAEQGTDGVTGPG
ncbi:hypothetical protein KVF89_12230 [Nocardioides carbamazepini]|uniref:hypothetical protein n=1 Tax=Nocardioides carbamazepini TaxID=2854259 RepID=UPI00214A328A|nr:hypothetical protein [Nocardioides carbamazepini]MCR1783305.1 hypothetical protein [Nocardioides carbamazepini]